MKDYKELVIEPGTNELAILKFKIDGHLFGINVDKVQEILQYTPINPMQKSHPDVEGIFKPRDEVITVINLAHHLQLQKSNNVEKDLFIVTNFSQETYAFHVHEVVDIARIRWSDMQKPDAAIYGGEAGVATAIAEHGDELVTILDFEKIIDEINPQIEQHLNAIEQLGERAVNNTPILVVEDSAILRRLVVSGLQKAGYTNITTRANGQDALLYVQELLEKEPPITDFLSCIITDIEMPVMDGRHFIKTLQSIDDPHLKNIPLVIFSSILSEQQLASNKKLGAAAQFSKPEMVQLVNYLDSVFSQN